MTKWLSWISQAMVLAATFPPSSMPTLITTCPSLAWLVFYYPLSSCLLIVTIFTVSFLSMAILHSCCAPWWWSYALCHHWFYNWTLVLFHTTYIHIHTNIITSTFLAGLPWSTSLVKSHFYNKVSSWLCYLHSSTCTASNVTPCGCSSQASSVQE